MSNNMTTLLFITLNFDLEAYLDGSFESLLDVQPLAHDGLIELPLKGQQVHVGLGLGH